jgi:hypothetical protein
VQLRHSFGVVSDELKPFGIMVQKIESWRADGERKFEPAGRHNHSPAWSRNAAKRWVWNKK